jgi:Flp pilus assembly protein TadG
MRPLWRDSQGQVLLLLAGMMVLLLGIAALALDGGMAYGVKARMNAAADAAAIAALKDRSRQNGTDSSAEVAAASYFHANFPADTMGLKTPPSCTVHVSTQNGAFVATVDATAVVPTFFAKVLGFPQLTVSSSSAATRSNYDVALVLDTSGSLGTAWPSVRQGAIDFLGKFSEQNDRVALVPFANGVGLTDVGGDLRLTNGQEINPAPCSPRFSQSAVDAKINALSVAGQTDTEFGLRIGVYELNKVAATDRAPRRAVVLFSDGAPNTFTGVFQTGASGTTTASGNLFSGVGMSDVPKFLSRADVTADDYPNNVSLFRVPSNGGGNYVGSVKLPSYSVENSRRQISYSDNSGSGLKCNMNKAARNLVENIADAARSQGIAFYAIGYGTMLDQPDISSDCSMYSEKGSTIMKRVANTKDSDTYNPQQPTGVYCFAQSTNDVGPCFDTIANAMMRLTK